MEQCAESENKEIKMKLYSDRIRRLTKNPK